MTIPASKAWCKFTEILNEFKLLARAMDTSAGKEAFRSCHLCEAPGAFITALNHHLQTTTDIEDFKCAREKNGQAGTHRKWSWMATTLHPHYEGHSTNQVLALAQFDFYVHLYFPFTKPTVTEVGSVSISISFTFCGTETPKKSCVSNMKKSCDFTSHPPISFLVLGGKIKRLNRIKKRVTSAISRYPRNK